MERKKKDTKLLHRIERETTLKLKTRTIRLRCHYEKKSLPLILKIEGPVTSISEGGGRPKIPSIIQFYHS